MQVAGDVPSRARHLNWATAVGDPRRVGVEEGSGPVVGAYFGKSGDAWQHIGWISIAEAPRLRRVVVARFQDDRGIAGAVTLQVKLAAAADVDRAGEVPVSGRPKNPDPHRGPRLTGDLHRAGARPGGRIAHCVDDLADRVDHELWLFF